MSDFDLQLDSGYWDQLDEFALLACQDFNYGNSGRWFNCFRGGLYGMRSRMQAARRHYRDLHAWLPTTRVVADPEYHLSTALFHMDSAIECMTFALNALGYAAEPAQFIDVTDAKSLKQIVPGNILRASVPGYSKYFPELQAHLVGNRATIEQVMIQHDVSKHRTQISLSGQCRLDAPPGFYERLGLGEDDVRRALFWPMKVVRLDPDPKAPVDGKAPVPVEGSVVFEELAAQLAECLVRAAQLAVTDARRTIPLKVSRLEQ